MVSFDVKMLLTNIPVSFTIKLIIDALYHISKSSNYNTLFNGFNQTKMKQFLEWVTKVVRFCLTMNILNKSMVFLWEAKHLICLLTFMFCVYRHVDDCFSVFNDKKSVTEFEKILNSIHPNIAFTT